MDDICQTYAADPAHLVPERFQTWLKLGSPRHRAGGFSIPKKNQSEKKYMYGLLADKGEAAQSATI